MSTGMRIQVRTSPFRDVLEPFLYSVEGVLNVAGYLPLISAISGVARQIIGVGQVVVGIGTKAVYTLLNTIGRRDYVVVGPSHFWHGISNIVRGLLETVSSFGLTIGLIGYDFACRYTYDGEPPPTFLPSPN